MRYWNFKVYRPEDAESQVEAWYNDQRIAVKSQFDGNFDALSQNQDAPETEFFPLQGVYAGLYEIVIIVDLKHGTLQINLIGIWQPDSSNFIIFSCCEK